MDGAPPSGESNPYGFLLSRPRGLALVIDDDMHMTSLVEVLLQDANFDVTIAHRGQEALNLMGLQSDAFGDPLVPDLIVLDYEMPDMTGYEVLSRVRQADHTRKVPVIMLTATNKNINEMVQQDLDAFLKKPFDNKTFIDAIVKVLSRKT